MEADTFKENQKIFKIEKVFQENLEAGKSLAKFCEIFFCKFVFDWIFQIRRLWVFQNWCFMKNLAEF